MRRTPRFVLSRNRRNGYAEEQAQGYKPAAAKTGGPCAVCQKVEDDHIFGAGDDGHRYTPGFECPRCGKWAAGLVIEVRPGDCVSPISCAACATPGKKVVKLQGVVYDV